MEHSVHAPVWIGASSTCCHKINEHHIDIWKSQFSQKCWQSLPNKADKLLLVLVQILDQKNYYIHRLLILILSIGM